MTERPRAVTYDHFVGPQPHKGAGELAQYRTMLGIHGRSAGTHNGAHWTLFHDGTQKGSVSTMAAAEAWCLAGVHPVIQQRIDNAADEARRFYALAETDVTAR